MDSGDSGGDDGRMADRRQVVVARIERACAGLVDRRLQAMDRAVLAVILLAISSVHGVAWVTRETIGDRTGLALKSVRNALYRLRRFGYVEWHRGDLPTRPGRMAILYHVHALPFRDLQAAIVEARLERCADDDALPAGHAPPAGHASPVGPDNALPAGHTIDRDGNQDSPPKPPAGGRSGRGVAADLNRLVADDPDRRRIVDQLLRPVLADLRLDAPMPAEALGGLADAPAIRAASDTALAAARDRLIAERGSTVKPSDVRAAVAAAVAAIAVPQMSAARTRTAIEVRSVDAGWAAWLDAIGAQADAARAAGSIITTARWPDRPGAELIAIGTPIDAREAVAAVEARA